MQKLTDFLANSLGVILALLTIWGIFHTFDRHGAGRGIVSVVLPPVAWYEGVAAFWEEPEWKENFRSLSERIAVVLSMAANAGSDPKLQSQMPEVKAALRKDLNQLPPHKRKELHSQSLAYKDAAVAYTEHFLDHLTDETFRTKEMPSSVQVHVGKFSDNRGLMSAWKAQVEQSDAMIPVLRKQIQGTQETMDNNRELKSILRIYLQALEMSMRQTIGDLFNESDK